MKAQEKINNIKEVLAKAKADDLQYRFLYLYGVRKTAEAEADAIKKAIRQAGYQCKWTINERPKGGYAAHIIVTIVRF